MRLIVQSIYGIILKEFSNVFYKKSTISSWPFLGTAIQDSLGGVYINGSNTTFQSSRYSDFNKKTFIGKIQTRFSKFGEHISAKDLLIIAALLLVESCLFIGVVEYYRKSLETKPVRIKCNDRTINQPMAPEAQTNWIPYLFTAGILLWCSMSIGHTISAMKNQDYESQTGILKGC